MEHSVVLTMRGISMTFPGVKALDNVDLTLYKGEIHALMGENGAGKSTLIKCLTGINNFEAGEIHLEGIDGPIRNHSTLDAQKKGISTVYQEVNLCPNLSVAENLYIGREPLTKFHTIDRKAMVAGARRIMADLDFDIDVTQNLENYSLALQQMIAIARAVDMDCKVLILDEPTSSLDDNEVEKLFTLMRKLRDQGVSIVFVTHFLEQVYALCGAFNGTLVAYLNAQPMVATLILYSAARAIGLLPCNNLIVYVRVPSDFTNGFFVGYDIFGSYIGPIPTPIIITAVCVLVMTLVLKKTALGLSVQSVGINRKASRIAGLNSQRLILLCYIICGLCAGIAGLVASSRITSADSNNIGLNYEMDAILAVALGGNTLGGGKFNLAGSIIGAYTIQAITTTMYNMGVSTSQAPVFKAIIVILIVVIQAPPFKAFMASRKVKREQKRAAKEAASV